MSLKYIGCCNPQCPNHVSEHPEVSKPFTNAQGYYCSESCMDKLTAKFKKFSYYERVSPRTSIMIALFRAGLNEQDIVSLFSEPILILEGRRSPQEELDGRLFAQKWLHDTHNDPCILVTNAGIYPVYPRDTSKDLRVTILRMDKAEPVDLYSVKATLEPYRPSKPSCLVM